jgi:hypothetical protein
VLFNNYGWDQRSPAFAATVEGCCQNDKLMKQFRIESMFNNYITLHPLSFGPYLLLHSALQLLRSGGDINPPTTGLRGNLASQLLKQSP